MEYWWWFLLLVVPFDCFNPYSLNCFWSSLSFDVPRLVTNKYCITFPYCRDAKFSPTKISVSRRIKKKKKNWNPKIKSIYHNDCDVPKRKFSFYVLYSRITKSFLQIFFFIFKTKDKFTTFSFQPSTYAKLR